MKEKLEGLLKLIEGMRARPEMYFGEKKICHLEHYLWGFADGMLGPTNFQEKTDWFKRAWDRIRLEKKTGSCGPSEEYLTFEEYLDYMVEEIKKELDA